MKNFIVDSWNGVMDYRFNPLKHIPDLQVRHMMLQVLEWLWCIAFSLYFASWTLFVLTVISHFILILAIVVTVATFKVSENVYRFKSGYHSPDRQRGHVYYRDVHGNAYRVPLPKNDPGGEHD